MGLEVRWSDPVETRSLEQITDIGIAFEERIDQLTGMAESSVPAVFRARQFLADTVASLHLDEYSGKVALDETPQILADPNPELTYHEFMNQVALDLIDHGNAYVYVTARDSRGNPTRGHVIPAGEMTVNWLDRTQLYRDYVWRDTRLSANQEVIHIAINRRAGELLGKGPIQAAFDTTIQAAKAEETLARSLAEDNFTPSVVIKSPEVKTKGDADRVRDMWVGDRKERRSLPSVMNSNSDLEQLTFKPIDAQWIEGRNFTVQQIGRLFGLHGIFLLVSSADSLTYATTESIFRLFLTATLRPTYLERIEQAFSRLLPSGRTARFNTNEILRADIVSRYQAHQIGLGGAGFLTVNEVRADEGLPPIKGGDELIVPSSTENTPTAKPRPLVGDPA
jgi:HK97 family phage portal protein